MIYFLITTFIFNEMFLTGCIISFEDQLYYPFIFCSSTMKSHYGTQKIALYAWKRNVKRNSRFRTNHNWVFSFQSIHDIPIKDFTSPTCTSN